MSVDDTASGGAHPWPRLTLRLPLVMVLLALVVLFFLLDLVLGSVRIPLSSVVSILMGNGSDIEAWDKIVTYIRLPKAVTAVLAGAALSVSGLQMQTLFRNPLAGPSVLGISAGASLGVAMVMLASGSAANAFAIRQLGLGGSWLIVISATLGAACVLLVVLAIAVRIKDNIVLLIVGIMVGNITVSLISIWQYFSEPEEIQDYLIWTFGSLGGVLGNQLWVLAAVIGIGLLVSFAASKSLNVMLLGENYARSLGMSTFYVRVTVIAATSLLAGSVTGFCGPIGFIGIAVPHLTRSILDTSDHRFLMPGVCLMGALVMLVCDIIAQMPGSQTTLPINAVTALIGSPVVIWVIMKNRNLKSSFS
ncbi:iron ABC transporter permease [Prosthecochloris sp. N3]|uniref:Iron ABC transporter permease n=1 Tax=Prosthecochloris ethylica TaxID=2743976 RepID=A0ABR9XSY0_9CHLB|nr:MULTISPECIES: iron ABC transporter permease [Prosthecochloris]MEC9487080.1 iron ABC transporter permease [Prosthecochloris sp.]MBF0585345.1 iron ABC transporter permease [Prosthecochloris ethylica]MBF0636881.1 iron ABC transporter permease [Prosthecochloris ethylica]NUK46574.1 iron ABC transporter permease [Prosthecochloris ethylica]RNA64809.1 iron ABC transporter permease [Prosthecochloris sp. ZM_2]